jgi:uncharacterized membrane protein YozB (DUF420 family)
MRSLDGSGTGKVIGKALAISVTISLLMMLTTLGFMYFFSANILPLPMAIILIVFAVSFIIAAVLIDRASENLLASFMGGASVALSVTIFVIALVSGVYFLIDSKPLPGLDMLLTGFAGCLIASLVINRLTLRL